MNWQDELYMVVGVPVCGGMNGMGSRGREEASFFHMNPRGSCGRK